MNVIFAIAAASFLISATAIPAQAGGCCGSSTTQVSSGGLINVSPSLQIGDVGVANGLNILGGTSFLTNNVLSGIVRGNNNNVGHGNVAGRQNAVGNGVVAGSIGNTVKNIVSGRLGRR